jgi:hypothetical protein
MSPRRRQPGPRLKILFPAFFDQAPPAAADRLAILSFALPLRRYGSPAATPNRHAQRRNQAWPICPEFSCTYIRRTLTVTRAATFKRRSRIVPTVARARSVPHR